jgi:hypothetical protein
MKILTRQEVREKAAIKRGTTVSKTVNIAKKDSSNDV